jgi:hypothetical protein
VADSNTPSITLQKSASIRPRPATFTWTYHAQAAIWIASMLRLAEGTIGDKPAKWISIRSLGRRTGDITSF